MATRGRKTKSGPLDGPIRDDSWNPPGYLSPRARSEYERLAAILLASGRAPATDPRLVESYAMTYDLMLDAYEILRKDGLTVEGSHGGLQRHPMLEALASAQTKLKALAEALSLTPRSKRSNITGPRKQTPSGESRGAPDWDGIIKFSND